MNQNKYHFIFKKSIIVLMITAIILSFLTLGYMIYQVVDFWGTEFVFAKIVFLCINLIFVIYILLVIFLSGYRLNGDTLKIMVGLTGVKIPIMQIRQIVHYAKNNESFIIFQVGASIKTSMLCTTEKEKSLLCNDLKAINPSILIETR